MITVELITPATKWEPIYQFLVEQMHVHYGRPFDSERNQQFLNLAEQFNPAKRSQAYVAYNEAGDVIGTGCLTPLAEQEHRPPHCASLDTWGYVSRIYVAENLHGQGVGRKIYEAIEVSAQLFGYTHLCLNTHRFLNKGCSFWQRQGYIEYEDTHDEWQTIWLSKELNALSELAL